MSNIAKNHCLLFPDGACSPNPGMGGWGAVIQCNGIEYTTSGFCHSTTSNRMELTVALEALRFACDITLKGYSIHAYSDSRYVVDGMSQWIKSWSKRNWVTASGSPVKNRDLWDELAALTIRRPTKWHWIRGHSGHRENELADLLAHREIETVRHALTSTKGHDSLATEPPIFVHPYG